MLVTSTSPMLDIQAKLKHKHSSFSNPKVIYGNAGDTVTIISVRDHVAIVESESGNRYPIALQALEFNISVAIESPPIELPPPMEPEVIKKKPIQKAKQVQQSLF